MVGILALVGAFACDDKPTTSPEPTVTAPVTTPEPTTTTTPAETAESPTPSASVAASAEIPEPPPDKTQPGATAKAPTAATASANVKGGDPKNPAETEPKTTKGQNVASAGFSAWLQGSGSFKAGEQGAVTVVLVSKAPYHCNDKYPYKFKLDPPAAGLSYPQSVVRGAQITPQRTTMSVPFLASAAGKATIAGELSFSVCTEERCLIEKQHLAVTVDVQ